MPEIADALADQKKDRQPDEDHARDQDRHRALFVSEQRGRVDEYRQVPIRVQHGKQRTTSSA
ncbi:MAG: hypothetical protein R3C45_08690 [Phycisphaerales bacterium]